MKKFGSSENSRTFALAFEEQRSEKANETRVLWKIYINREVVVQEAVNLLLASCLAFAWVDCVEDTNRSIFIDK